jgi:hypothetical protein
VTICRADRHEIVGVSERSFDRQMAIRSVIDRYFVQIEFVVDADAQDLGDAGKGRGRRIRGRPM